MNKEYAGEEKRGKYACEEMKEEYAGEEKRGKYAREEIKEEYVREGGLNYWKVTLGDGMKSDADMRMVMRNRIPGLLCVRESNEDNCVVYYYELGHMKPLDVLCQKKEIEYSAVVNMLVELDRLRKRLSGYLLDWDGIPLSGRHVFVDDATGEVRFAYAPFLARDDGRALKSLLEYVMEHMDYGSRKNNVRFYEAYQLVMRGRTDIGELVGVLTLDENVQEPLQEELEIPTVMCEEVDEEVEVKVKIPGRILIAVRVVLIVATVVIVWSQAFSKSFFIEIGFGNAVVGIVVVAALYYVTTVVGRLPVMHETKVVKVKQKVPYSVGGDEVRKDSFEFNSNESICGERQKYRKKSDGAASPEKTLSEIASPELPLKNEPDENPTQLLTDFIKKKKGLYLEFLGEEAVSIFGSDVIEIEKLPCVVGSGKNADLPLGLPYVSRAHLNIEKDVDYYVTDMFSSNGTSLNDNPLSPGKRMALADGDVLAIAGYRAVVRIEG